MNWTTFFTQAPVFIASALEEELEIPVQSYYPTDVQTVVDSLPSGWIEWEGSLEEVVTNDRAVGISVGLAVTIVLDASNLESAVEAQRGYMGKVLDWCQGKKRLTVAEVGGPVHHFYVSEVDWIELTEMEGITLYGKTIRVVRVLLQLEFTIKK